jgi:sugar/nucleoside kinase (ribokinase family)
MTPDVTVLGDALLDVTVVPDGPVRHGGDVPASIRIATGGQGANVAVRLARLGIVVRLACALGGDATGRLVRESLEEEGIEVDARPCEATGAVTILLGTDGERTMLSRRAPLLPRAVDGASWTVVSGYVLLEDPELDLRGGERRAVLGCAVPDGRAGTWWHRVVALRPDVVVLNADEARDLGGDARALAAGSGAIVVVTDADEATAAHPGTDGPRRVAVSRRPAVDSTGTGDAFAAAYLAELSDWPPSDDDLARALAAGARLAGDVAGVEGAQGRVAAERVTS